MEWYVMGNFWTGKLLSVKSKFMDEVVIEYLKELTFHNISKPS
jgi:hypothetical protein